MQNTKSRFVHRIKSKGGGKDSTLSIIILSSTPGYRMRSFGPKCLIKDRHGHSILEHQIAIFEENFNNYELIVVGGFEADKLAKNLPNKVRMVENQLFNQENEISDIRLAINNTLNNNLLIIFGDMYFSSGAIKDITEKSSLLIDNNSKMLEDDIGTTVVDEYVTIMSMSIKSPKWSKVAYFSDKESKLLRQFVSNRDNSRLFLFEGINYILENGGNFVAKFVGLNEILVHVDNTQELGKI